MNCDWVKSNVTLYVYDELADDARYELEQHIERCKDCAAEVKAERGFRDMMSAFPVPEPSPNLLTASRMRLQESLETAEQARGWRRFVLDPMSLFQRYKVSPAMAAALLIVGFIGGAGSAYKLALSRVTQVDGSMVARSADLTPGGAAQTEASIVGIRTIAQDPGSNRVDIKYDALVPQQASGSLDDPRVQQLLLFAARNNTNSGVRMDSVDLLAQKNGDERVRELLIYALRNDSNPGVRLKALESLGPYVRQDVGARNAVLDAMMNDENPGVRTLAIQLVSPAGADSSVRQVLDHLARADQSASIRTQARTVLAAAPHID